MNLVRLMAVTGALLACSPAGAWAASDARPGDSSRAAPPAPMVLAAASLSMDEAVKMAEQRFHARVVRAETHVENGRTVYELRLLNEAGRVWTVRVDAASGALR